MNMIKFETGKTYRTRSPGDHDCVLDYKIISRTAKTLKSYGMPCKGDTTTIKIYGVQVCGPFHCSCNACLG